MRCISSIGKRIQYLTGRKNSITFSEKSEKIELNFYLSRMLSLTSMHQNFKNFQKVFRHFSAILRLIPAKPIVSGVWNP